MTELIAAVEAWNSMILDQLADDWHRARAEVGVAFERARQGVGA